MRLCSGGESRNFYSMDKYMAIMTYLLRTARGYTFLAVAAIILAGSFNIFATGNNAAERKARTLEAEQKLSDLGYWITNVDGASDDSTRQAILAFQKVEGLKRTGVLDEQVIEAAKTGDFALERVDNDRLQKWLESLDPDELGKYRM